MKRAHVLALIRYAGYHNNAARMLRLYVENRVSYPIAKKEFNDGYALYKNGAKCKCSDCNV